MKTIEGPLKTKARVYRFRCSYKDCQALLEVARDELTKRQGRYNEVMFSFDCPHCKGVSFLSPDDLKLSKTYPPLN